MRGCIAQSKINLPPKLSATLRPYPGTKGRNPFQSSTKAVSEFILEDIARAKDLERTFLKACYCNSGALSEYSLLSKQILQARYAALFDPERPRPSTVPVVEYGLVTPELLAQSFSRRPILLIGDIGVGKTTFIRQFINTDPSFPDQAIAIYIDFGSRGTLAADLRTYILAEIDRQLQEDYGIDAQAEPLVRRIYDPELRRFSTGVNRPLKERKSALYQEKEIELLQGLVANKEEHLRRALELLSGDLRKQIVIFLDNTDQRSEQDQQAAFLIGQEMADRWQAVIYITLRPETYHASVRRGALTGYHPKAFTIAPPRIERVIRKRLIFGLRVTSGRIPLGTRGGHMEFASLEVLLRVFLRSMPRQGRDREPGRRELARDELMRCIENIASGNVRLALELVRSFFGSGHVDTQKIITKVRDEGGYEVPLHEFQRAIIYGDNVHYDPSRSPIANVFDVSSLDPREHFLQPLILGCLRLPGLQQSDGGFVPVQVIYESCQSFGFTPEQIDVALVRAFSKRLLETGARRIPEPGRIDGYAIRATPVGLYHIQELMGTFTYLDAVVVDTPVLNRQFRERIGDAHTLAERVERATHFCDYLDSCWQELPSGTLPVDWPEKSGEARALLRRLLQK